MIFGFLFNKCSAQIGLKKSYFDWCERQNAQKVIILRPKRKVKTEKIPKIEGKYNYLLNATEYEKITETL